MGVLRNGMHLTFTWFPIVPVQERGRGVLENSIYDCMSAAENV